MHIDEQGYTLIYVSGIEAVSVLLLLGRNGILNYYLNSREARKYQPTEAMDSAHHSTVLV